MYYHSKQNTYVFTTFNIVKLSNSEQDITALYM